MKWIYLFQWKSYSIVEIYNGNPKTKRNEIESHGSSCQPQCPSHNLDVMQVSVFPLKTDDNTFLQALLENSVVYMNTLNFFFYQNTTLHKATKSMR